MKWLKSWVWASNLGSVYLLCDFRQEFNLSKSWFLLLNRDDQLTVTGGGGGAGGGLGEGIIKGFGDGHISD